VGWLHKLRAALVLPGREPLGPFAQIDEPHRSKGLAPQGAGSGGRRGRWQVRLAHADNNDEGMLKSFADSQIALDTQVVTDGLASYNNGSLGQRPHQAVIQTKQERRGATPCRAATGRCHF
jgi:hypothetical protein